MEATVALRITKETLTTAVGIEVIVVTGVTAGIVVIVAIVEIADVVAVAVGTTIAITIGVAQEVATIGLRG